MRRPVGFADARRQRRIAFAPRDHAIAVAGTAHAAFGEPELRLARADQFQIDLGQDLGVEQRAVLGAP